MRTSLLGSLATLIGAGAVLGGAAVAYLNFRGTLELNRRGQVTERFTKAIDQLGQLGPERLSVRLGGIYALEQIASDSTDLHWQIMEVLTAYLRENAGFEEGGPPEPPLPADRQAIMTVIGRRKVIPEPTALNLRHVDLRGVDLREACLRGVNFSHAHLEGAILTGTCMVEADLTDTHLEWARLEGANLSGTKVRKTRSTGTEMAPHLHCAKLDGVILHGAHRLIAEAVKEEELKAATADQTARCGPKRGTVT